jgi:hypothetical protein
VPLMALVLHRLPDAGPEWSKSARQQPVLIQDGVFAWVSQDVGNLQPANVRALLLEFDLLAREERCQPLRAQMERTRGIHVGVCLLQLAVLCAAAALGHDVPDRASCGQEASIAFHKHYQTKVVRVPGIDVTTHVLELVNHNRYHAEVVLPQERLERLVEGGAPAGVGEAHERTATVDDVGPVQDNRLVGRMGEVLLPKR